MVCFMETLTQTPFCKLLFLPSRLDVPCLIRSNHDLYLFWGWGRYKLLDLVSQSGRCQHGERSVCELKPFQTQNTFDM